VVTSAQILSDAKPRNKKHASWFVPRIAAEVLKKNAKGERVTLGVLMSRGSAEMV
jgi:hypothetical protein